MAQDILLGNVEAKNRVVIVGGGLVGCETALSLAMAGKSVTIVEALPDILKSGIAIPPMNEWMLRDLLTFYKVELVTNSRLDSVSEQGATVVSDNDTKLIEAEQTILSIGYRSKSPVYDACQYEYEEVYKLGDSKQVKNIRNAIWDGYEVARNI